MKIALAQLNPVVGDIKGNLKKIKDTLEKFSPEADLIVFPELFLTGCPPKDLLKNSEFIAKVNSAVDELIDLSRSYQDTGILLGCPVETGSGTGKGRGRARGRGRGA